MSVVAGCTAPDASPPMPVQDEGTAPQRSAAGTVDATPPYSEKLQWMLDKAEFAEDPGTPCLRREIERPGWVEDPTVQARMREVRSDSLWLGGWARENLGNRLAYATVRYDWEPDRGEPYPAEPPPLIYEIAVTGSAPVDAPPLGGRAKGVPVRIAYDVPYSHDEFMERRRIGGEVARQLLDTIGEGGSPENGWAVRLDVYSKEGKPEPQALALCDRLRRAYDLPVLMEFSSARIVEEMGS